METRNYELMFIVNPDLADEALDSVLQRVQRYLAGANAQVYNFKSWGMRRLAYTLKGYRDGRYYLSQFAATSDTVNELDRNLRVVEGVLRHMITRMDDSQVPEVTEPAAETDVSEPAAEAAVSEPETVETAPEPAMAETAPEPAMAEPEAESESAAPEATPEPTDEA